MDRILRGRSFQCCGMDHLELARRRILFSRRFWSTLLNPDLSVLNHFHFIESMSVSDRECTHLVGAQFHQKVQEQKKEEMMHDNGI